MPNASLVLRIQALGGKFLGPNAYQTNQIVAALRYSGGELHLPYQLTNQLNSDGEISPVFTAGSSSFLPILTMPAGPAENPAVNYLTPNANTIGAQVSFALPAAIEVATLWVQIPTPLGGMLTLTQPLVLAPDQTQYLANVVVPGLLLTPGTVDAQAGTVSVYVKMMCGCKVTVGLPTSYWTPTDFVVQAMVSYSNGTQLQCPLGFDVAANASLFSGPVPNLHQVTSILLTARQLSTGNVGAVAPK